MTNSDPHIPQPPQTLPDKLRAIGWGRHSYTGTEIRDICEEAARALEGMPVTSSMSLSRICRKAAALDWLMREAMDERRLANNEARTEIQLIIPSRYPAREDGDYLDTLERAREECAP